MLGIECDGYAYHSSKAARDRDRIRHDVLTGLGWHLHHIWGTAWYRHRESAEDALRDALQRSTKSGSPHEASSRPPKPKPAASPLNWSKRTWTLPPTGPSHTSPSELFVTGPPIPQTHLPHPNSENRFR